MGELRFDDRAVIVTGAGRGVGRAHAQEFAARGAKVVVADLGGALEGGGRDNAPAEEVVKEIQNAGGEAVAVCASVAEDEGAKAIVEAALDSFGRIDVVVNNAGIADPDRFEDLTIDRFRQMVEVHYLGTVNVCLQAYPHLLKAGYGRIVNTCSEGAFGTVPKATSYGGAKGGVFSFTRELALEAAPRGILVNAVSPRANTRLSAPAVLAKTYDLPEDAFGDSIKVFRPELVSPAALYLGHESCRFNGQVLVCGGGQVHRLAVVESPDIAKEDLSPEDIAAGFDTLMDLANSTELTVTDLRESH
jgi:NAD(P)-dependent dehydrogenase (short-subunit alcohol dehydrogenase family)